MAAELKRIALVLMVEHGIQGLSLRQAAQLAGVSPGAVYRHFSDKASLMAAIARDGFTEMAACFETALRTARLRRSEPTAAARFVALGSAYVAFAVDYPQHFQIMFSPFGAGEDASHVHLARAPVNPYSHLCASLDALVAAGLVEQDRRAGAELICWSAVHGLACLLVAGALNKDGKPVGKQEAQNMAECVSRDLLQGLIAVRATPKT